MVPTVKLPQATQFSEVNTHSNQLIQTLSTFNNIRRPWSDDGVALIVTPGSTNIKSVRPSFDTPTDTIVDWLNVERVRWSHLLRCLSSWLERERTYSNVRTLFCEFFGVATVNHWTTWSWHHWLSICSAAVLIGWVSQGGWLHSAFAHDVSSGTLGQDRDVWYAQQRTGRDPSLSISGVLNGGFVAHHPGCVISSTAATLSAVSAHFGGSACHCHAFGRCFLFLAASPLIYPVLPLSSFYPEI